MVDSPVEEFIDDVEAISDAEILVRLIPPDAQDWENTDASGRPRIKSGGVQDSSKERTRARGYPGRCMSVWVLSVAEAHGQTTESLLGNRREVGFGLARFVAGDLREPEQGICMWTSGDDPWHAVVFSKKGSKRSDRQKDLTAQAGVWEIAPTRWPET